MNMKGQRMIKFLTLHREHPIFLFLYVLFFKRDTFTPKVRFLEPDQFAELLAEGKTFIRFGDGEAYILNGGSIPSQTFDKVLQRKMKQIITQYSSKSPYIVGLSRFVTLPNSKLRSESLFLIWYPTKILFTLFFPKNVSYGDAHFFYFDSYFKKYLEPILLDKHMIIVTNEVNILTLQKNKTIPFKNIEYVETPDKNAFSQYSNIKQNIMNLVKNHSKKDVVVAIAAGPTSKILAYELSLEDIMAVDIGTGIEAAYGAKSLEEMYSKVKLVKTV